MEQTQAFLNARELAQPSLKFKKLYGQANHFRANANTLRNEDAANKSALADDGELFDKEMAMYAMHSPQAKQSLNPLFQNTKQFNVSTLDYRNLKQ